MLLWLIQWAPVFGADEPLQCQGMTRASDQAGCGAPDEKQPSPEKAERKTQHEESLEVVLVVATEKGPQFTSAGCFVYGQFFATVVKERESGVALIAQLSRMRDIRDNERVPGIYEFLVAETLLIYNLPEGFLELEWTDLRDAAAKRCREAQGATWIMRERT